MGSTLNNDDDDALTPEERAVFEALPREQSPPSWLEERIAGRLRQTGQIGTTSAWRRAALGAGALAAALTLFVTGLGVGWQLAAPATEGRPAAGTGALPSGAEHARWLLLLYEDVFYQAPGPGAERARILEYGAWARSLAERGRLVAGEKLKESGTILARDGEALEVVSRLPRSEEGILAGYFVIEAPSIAEAIAEARGCPHLRYGGRISLREIEVTSKPPAS